MALERLFVLFIHCNPADDFDVGGDGRVFVVADFDDAAECWQSWPLTLVTQSGVRNLI